MNSSTGFTLIELMITLALVSLLMTLGIPSFNEAIRNNRLTTYTNDLVTALNLARSEAVKRNLSVSVRKSGTDWEDGWEVFTDLDSDGTFDDDGDATLCESGEDCVLRVFEALPASFTLRGNNNFANFIRYTSAGLSNNMGSFVLCENSDGNNVPEARTAKMVIVNAVGRTRIAGDADNDGIPEKTDGTEINSCVAF
ncbi:GspH/FimT family pseudopilin [Thiolapillus sp.]|uniref:GspH/FimT family pseudopilin n=1 Tax=Thiolapillus sp. TaxID=2017437 RepID=UPI003AF999EE